MPSSTKHHRHRRQRGYQREIDGTGEVECPGRQRLRDDEAQQTTKKDSDKVALLHMFLRHEGGNEPEHQTGTQRTRGHIAHRGDPLIEQEFGDRDTQSEDRVGEKDGAVRLQFLIFHSYVIMISSDSKRAVLRATSSHSAATPVPHPHNGRDSAGRASERRPPSRRG